MQDAKTVLNVIRERGERGLPLENIYRQLYNRVTNKPTTNSTLPGEEKSTATLRRGSPPKSSSNTAALT